jgi:pyrroline-5-carboxylate reductase
VFYLAEAMEQAGVKLGLPKDISRKLSYKTIFGAGKMLTELSDDAEILRKKVTSPGGTTEAAICSMSKDKFLDIVIEAVKKADKRAKELSKR